MSGIGGMRVQRIGLAAPRSNSAFKVFRFEARDVRIVDQGGQPWFVLADACAALGLSNPTVVASRLDEDERAKLSLGRQGEGTIINESGLYTVILRSDKPEAKRFRKWVTSEVLPSIRKTGGYHASSSGVNKSTSMPKPATLSAALVRECRISVEHGVLSRAQIAVLLGVPADGATLPRSEATR